MTTILSKKDIFPAENDLPPMHDELARSMDAIYKFMLENWLIESAVSGIARIEGSRLAHILFTVASACLAIRRTFAAINIRYFTYLYPFEYPDRPEITMSRDTACRCIDILTNKKFLYKCPPLKGGRDYYFGVNFNKIFSEIAPTLAYLDTDKKNVKSYIIKFRIFYNSDAMIEYSKFLRYCHERLMWWMQ